MSAQPSANQIDRAVDFVRDSVLARVVIGFAVAIVVSAVAADLAGFPTVAAIIVAFGIIIAIVSVLFVAIPISALSLLD